MDLSWGSCSFLRYAMRPEIEGILPVEPLDIGCGTLLPMRWSRYCAVYRYDHKPSSTACAVEEKPSDMHVLVQTTAGRWDLHGKAGFADVDDRVLVAGAAGLHYGCRRDARYNDSNLIASLRAGALDEGEPLFHGETLPLDLSLLFKRALSADTIDEFDSYVFEMFDLTLLYSLREQAARRRSRVRTERIKRFIEQHALERLTLDDIAASARLSPFACLRQFKASTGLTPHAYLNEIRLSYAQRLLRRPDASIAAVAERLGFSQQSYFARWFAKATGISPSEFRNIAGS